jgi:hypothetical protein
MRPRWERLAFNWYISGCAAVLGLLSGCQVIEGYRPVVVEVRDAETHKPIPGAEITASYPDSTSVFSPGRAWASTGGDGIARLNVAPTGELGTVFATKAKGYLDTEKDLSTEAVRAMDPVHLFEDAEDRPVNVIVEMFAEPIPAIELVIPPGFRGIVQANLRDHIGPAWALGQRSMRFTVPASGIVEVSGPAWLPHYLVPDFHVRFADGTLITARGEKCALGYWWLRCEGTTQYFLIGTAHDYEDYHLFSHATPDPAAAPAVGGQRGHRSRP